MNEGWDLRLPFDTDDAQFTRGVEVGIAYAMLRSDEAPLVMTLHWSNAEMVIRLGEVTGRDVKCDQLDDEWMVAMFARKDAE